MSLRRLFVLLGAVFAVGVAATLVVTHMLGAQGGGAADGRPTDLSASAYAYATENDVIVVRGSTTVAKVNRISDEGNLSGLKMAWTNNGKYVVFYRQATASSSTSHSLIYVNTVTGRQRTIACADCVDFAATGTNSILVTAASSLSSKTVRKIDLDTPALMTTVTVPRDSRGNVGVIVSSTKDYVATVAMYEAGPSNATQAYVQIGRIRDGATLYSAGDGTQGEFVTLKENGVGAVEAVMVDSLSDPGACADQPTAIVMDAAGALTDTDLSAAIPPGSRGGAQVNDLWWGADGHAYLTLASYTCDTQGNKTLVSPSAMWRLDGRTWHKYGTRPASVVRQLDQTTQLSLVQPDCVGKFTVPPGVPNGTVYCNSGDLYQDQAGERTLIAHGVLAIAAPPLPSVAGLSPAPQISHATASTQAGTKAIVKLGYHLVPDPAYGPGYTTSGTYPQFTGTADLGAVNVGMRGMIAKDQKANKALYARIYGAARSGLGTGYYSSDPAKGIISASSALVSVLIPRTAIFPGGNDGNGWLSATILVPSAETVSLNSLFTDPTRGLDAIAANVKSQAFVDYCIGPDINSSAYSNAIAPLSGNYRHFALSPRGITVGFDQGQIGTEACGAEQFTVPWSKLRPLLNSSGSQLVGQLR